MSGEDQPHKFVEWYVLANKWKTVRVERIDQGDRVVTILSEKCVGVDHIPSPSICARCSWIAQHPNHF